MHHARVALLFAALAALPSCTSAAGDHAVVVAVSTPTTTSTATTTTAPSTTTAVATTVRPATGAANPQPPAARPPRPRSVTEQAWTPFATVGGVTLRHPSSRVERVGFHEANHDGARQLEPLPTAVSPVTLESRNRPTDSRTAADVVVDPAVEIRSPATGRVRVAGTYTLYCDYTDSYLIIEPDEHPGWQVKILHINGLRVSEGDRLIAGETVVARAATKFPFQSQVDEIATGDAPWPHTHIEVIDPSIPDIPSAGGGCD